MTISGYIPPAIYETLFKVAREQHLAIKEVEWILVREALKPFGFKCDHERVGIAKTTGLPFCKDCYQRLEMITSPTYSGRKLVKAATYRALPTFITPNEMLSR